MVLIASSIPAVARLGHPVVDQAGLTGKFDFTPEWTPEPNGPAALNADIRPDPQGPTLPEALHRQLGLKLESTKGPMQILVVDHIERPSKE